VALDAVVLLGSLASPHARLALLLRVAPTASDIVDKCGIMSSRQNNVDGKTNWWTVKG
jgi:hypothetical protein